LALLAVGGAAAFAAVTSIPVKQTYKTGVQPTVTINGYGSYAVVASLGPLPAGAYYVEAKMNVSGLTGCQLDRSAGGGAGSYEFAAGDSAPLGGKFVMKAGGTLEGGQDVIQLVCSLVGGAPTSTPTVTVSGASVTAYQLS